MSSEERKKTFRDIFMNKKKLVRFTPITFAREDPYDDKTWLSTQQLVKLRSEKLDIDQIFRERYIFDKNSRRDIVSITNPVLYNVHWKSVDQLFNEILMLNKSLILKLTPLFRPGSERYNQYGEVYYLTDFELEQIYNEIKIFYFLNELVYNYKHVLSLHFMNIVDWFIMPIEVHNPITKHNDKLFYQVSIAEKLSYELHDYLEKIESLSTGIRA